MLWAEAPWAAAVVALLPAGAGCVRGREVAASGAQQGVAPSPACPAPGPLAGALRPPPQPHRRRQLALSVTEAAGPCGSCFPRPGGWRRVAAGVVPVEAALAPVPQDRLHGSGGGSLMWGGPLVRDLAGWPHAPSPLRSNLEDGAPVTPSTVPGWRRGIWGCTETEGTPRGLEAPP